MKICFRINCTKGIVPSTKSPILFLFLLGLFLIPLFFWPFAEIAYEIPKVWLLHRWVELLVIISLFKGLANKTKLEMTKLWLLLALLLAAILSVAVNHSWEQSFFGNWYRADGLTTLFHLAALTVFLEIFWQKSWHKYFKNTVIFTSIVISAWAVWRGLAVYLFSLPSQEVWQGAIGISFGQPNFLAGYLLINLTLIIQELLRSKQKLFWFAAVSLLIMALIFTKSRSAVGGIVLVPALVYFVNKFQHLNRKNIFIGAIALIIIYHASFILYEKALFMGKPINYSYPFEGRERIYTIAWKAWQDKPFLGWGWANFSKAFDMVNKELKTGINSYVDKAHSSSLEYLVTTGLAGFIVYWFLIYLNLVKIKKEYLAMFLVFVLYSQTNVLSIASEMIFWLLIGMTTSKMPEEQKIARR